MPERTAVIGPLLGLHSRPAALFVQAVNATGLPIVISRDDHKPVDARSVLAVMALGAKHGETVTLACDESAEADEALDRLVALLASETGTA